MKKGTTTRLVDRYIQELFNNGITYVYEGRNTEKAGELTQYCMQIFVKRMNYEHSEVLYKYEYVFESGFYSYKITLND